MAFPWFLYIVNPSVNPPYGDCQLPVRGAFLYSTIKLLHPLPYICVTKRAYVCSEIRSLKG